MADRSALQRHTGCGAAGSSPLPLPADTGSGAGARARFTNRSGPRSPQKRSRRAGRPGFCSPRWLRSCVDVRELRSRRPPSKPVWRRRGRAGGDSAQRRRGPLPHGSQTARGTLIQVDLRTIKFGSLQPFCTTVGSLGLAATPQHFTHSGQRMVVASRWAVLTVSDCVAEGYLSTEGYPRRAAAQRRLEFSLVRPPSRWWQTYHEWHRFRWEIYGQKVGRERPRGTVDRATSYQIIYLRAHR